MEGRAHAVLDAAGSAGARLFAAARSYGQAEAFLASWLKRRDVGEGQAFVSSKWGYRYVADWSVDAEVHEVKQLTAENFHAQWPTTCSLLGDWLCLYQVHSLTTDPWPLDDPALFEALGRLKQKGVLVGFSTSGPAQGATIDRAIELRIDGVRLFDSVQTTWNPLERSAGPALARAKGAGLMTFAKESLANGRLTPRGDLTLDAPEFADRSIDAIAIAAALAQPFIDVVLSGAVTVDQWRSNKSAFDCPPASALAMLDAVLCEPPEAYWRTRGALPWQ